MSKRKHQEDPNEDESTKTCKSECRHINQAVDLQELKQTLMKSTLSKLLSFSAQCKESKKVTFAAESEEEHLELKFGNFLLLLCDHNKTRNPLRNKHGLQDHKIPRSVLHALFVDTSTWNVWCYECYNFVNVTCNKELLELVEYLQERAKDIENRAENVLLSDSSLEKNDNNKIIEETLLSELECPVCFNYIIPPIHQCVTGHNICDVCKIKVAECPTCKSEFRNTRNFALEQMTHLISYPCKFAESGCDFACKSGQIREHQKLCVYKPHICPLKDYVDCNWVDSAKNIYKHILEKHPENVLKKDLISVFINANYLAREDAACYVIKFEDRLFKLHYSYKIDSFYWAVQLIGPSEDAKKYQFEIDIIDYTARGQRMSWRRTCAPLTEKNQSFQNVGTYVFSHLNQIRPFISDILPFITNILTCRVRIDLSI